VLPEYCCEPNRPCSPEILSELQRVCQQFQISIVAALIIAQDAPCAYPPSSAYLIDPNSSPKLMCQKNKSDSLGWPESSIAKRYAACQNDCDRENPTYADGTKVGALICMDAFDAADERCRRLLKDLSVSSVGVPEAVLCVPAASETVGPERVSRVWTHHCVIFANSYVKCDNTLGCSSFITRNGVEIKKSEFGSVAGKEDSIVTWDSDQDTG
jgi:hypothetical protein